MYVIKKKGQMKNYSTKKYLPQNIVNDTAKVGDTLPLFFNVKRAHKGLHCFSSTSK